jgi:polysaccharide pyruvyl transferase WcaK-like protein
LVLGGGGLLYDRDAEQYLREVFIANELAIPVMLYAISAGPLTTQASRQAVQRALNVSPAPVITVRDRLGYRLLEDVGVAQDIHLTADPAFLLQPDELSIDALKAEGVDFDRHLIGFSVREPGPAAPDIEPAEYYVLLANAADFMLEREDTNVVFVPMEKTDVQHSHAVVAQMQNAERAEILRRRYSPRQVLDLMGRFDRAVGMRPAFSHLRRAPWHSLRRSSLRVEGDRVA